MWSDERDELKRQIKESLVTGVEWLIVWAGMFALIISTL